MLELDLGLGDVLVIFSKILHD